MNYQDVIEQIDSVLRSHCDDPVAEIRKMGEAMIGIAQALDGRSVAEARAIIEAVRQLQLVQR